jgi:uncharacterized protein (DUF362 family)
MKRREFLKFAVSACMAGGLAGSIERLFADNPPVVSLSEGTDFAAITRTVLGPLGGMQRFVKPGNVVVVKPNIGWDRRPEYGACTHPLVVRAIAEECVKAGAKKVKVFDNTCNDARRCYENSGIQEALKDLKNVELKFMESERFKNIKIDGSFLKEWEVYDEALAANVLINVPVAKHHSLTKLTLGLKNMMGILGGNRGYIHRGIDEAMADVSRAVKSHLTVIDATRILLNHGPQGGSLKDVRVLNRVIASTDIVAADAYASTLFSLRPEDVSTTVAAYKRGLGELDLKKMKVVKA